MAKTPYWEKNIYRPEPGKINIHCTRKNLFGYEWRWACRLTHGDRRIISGRSREGYDQCRENLLKHIIKFHPNLIPKTARALSVGQTELS